MSNRHTDSQTDHATKSVTIACILFEQPNNNNNNNSGSSIFDPSERSRALTDIARDPFCCRRRRQECLYRWCVGTGRWCRDRTEPRRSLLCWWCCRRRRTREPTSGIGLDSSSRCPAPQHTVYRVVYVGLLTSRRLLPSRTTARTVSTELLGFGF